MIHPLGVIRSIFIGDSAEASAAVRRVSISLSQRDAPSEKLPNPSVSSPKLPAINSNQLGATI